MKDLAKKLGRKRGPKKSIVYARVTQDNAKWFRDLADQHKTTYSNMLDICFTYVRGQHAKRPKLKMI